MKLPIHQALTNLCLNCNMAVHKSYFSCQNCLKGCFGINNLENIKLIDAAGKEIKGAIFNNVYELWDFRRRINW